MSVLEAQAEPVLSPLLTDLHSKRLTSADQEVLATWVYKTALVLVTHVHSRGIPELEYRRFHEDRRPAGHILLGAYGGGKRHGRYSAAGVTFRPNDPHLPPVSFVVAVLSLYRPVFRVVHFDEADSARFGNQRSRELIQLWPPTGADVMWPPPRLYSDSDLETLFDLRNL